LVIALLGLLDDPSLPPGVLGGVDAELAEEEEALLPVEDVDDEEDLELVVSSVVEGLLAGERGSFSSATPFSSGKTSGCDGSEAPSLPSPLSATETDGATSSPVFDLSLPLSLSRIAEAFSLPF
jgi:hypothetical protein